MGEIKIFEGDYDKREFYFYMGDVFASRDIRNDMPYLYNEEDRVWFLYMIDDELAGFASIQENKSNVEFKNDYVLEEHRDSGILEQLLDERLKYLKQNGINKNIKVAPEKFKDIEIYIKKGFEIYRETKNYVFMRKEKKNA